MSNISIIGPHHTKNKQQTSKIIQYLIIAFGGLLFTIILQLLYGLKINSNILITTGLHTIVDAINILSVIMVLKLSNIKNNTKFTYGFTRLETLLSFTNGILLIIIIIPIFFNHIYDVFAEIFHLELHEENHHTHNHNINFTHGFSTIILIISIISLFTHLLATIIMYSINNKNNNLLVKSVFLHLINDVATSFIAIIAAIVLLFTNIILIDTIISIIVLCILIVTLIRLLFKTSKIILEAVPSNLNIKEIKDYLQNNITNLEDIYHIHIWNLNEDEILSSMLIKTKPQHYLEVKNSIKNILANKYNIHHVTLELDQSNNNCMYDTIN